MMPAAPRTADQILAKLVADFAEAGITPTKLGLLHAALGGGCSEAEAVAAIEAFDAREDAADLSEVGSRSI